MANPFHFSKKVGYVYVAVSIAAFLLFHFYIGANMLTTLLLTVPCGVIGIITLANPTDHSEQT
ncbi:hypothetical protein MKX54_04845 [Alkalihalobacillus sp. FSL R5-0424]